MEKKISEHDEVINNNILPRLKIVEEMQVNFGGEVAALKTDLAKVQTGQANLEKGQKDLELTVMKDGKETRDLLKPFADHVLNQAEFDARTKKEVAIKKMDTREKVFLSIFGTGGVAGIIAGVVALMNNH